MGDASSACVLRTGALPAPRTNGTRAVLHRRYLRSLMNRSDLCSLVAAASLSKADATLAVAASLSAIADTLASAETVNVAGFGTFSTTTRAVRRRRKPATGESIDIDASTAPRFKACKTLRDAVNRRDA